MTDYELLEEQVLQAADNIIESFVIRGLKDHNEALHDEVRHRIKQIILNEINAIDDEIENSCAAWMAD